MLDIHHLVGFADACPLVHIPHSPVSNTIGSQSSPRGIKRRSRSPEYDIATGERLDEGTADSYSHSDERRCVLCGTLSQANTFYF